MTGMEDLACSEVVKSGTVIIFLQRIKLPKFREIALFGTPYSKTLTEEFQNGPFSF